MIRVLFITRSTWLKGFGGDSLQLSSTAKYLGKLGVEVDIKSCRNKIHYDKYDLIHIFNIIRPADTLSHILKSGKPYVISTIFLDYEDFEKSQRKGLLKLLNLFLSKDAIEYLKTIGRYLKNAEKISSLQYVWLGHRKSILQLAKGADLLLPNSHSEYNRLEKYLGFSKDYMRVFNGIDLQQHKIADNKLIQKEENLVICVARIEGNKNQLNLIKALNNTEFKLKIIGKPAPNHLKYYRECKKIAADNIEFTGFISLEGLIENYRKAKVHILPSFCETCGLSSLEAAFHQCSLVITKGGDTEEYFQEEAIYCDPNDTDSILQAVRKACSMKPSEKLYEKILSEYTWENAAQQSLQAYRKVLQSAQSKQSAITPSV